MNTRLHRAVLKYDSIEFVAIYPHRLFIGMDIQYSLCGKITYKTDDADDIVVCRFINIFNQEERLKLFSSLEDDTNQIKCICVMLDAQIAIFDVLNLLENITIKLKENKRKINTNKQ